jgi:hypothetical protein
MAVFNYSKLRGRIREKCNTEGRFADLMNLSTVSLSKKLNNKSEWTQTEILKACEVLQIESRKVPEYFFAD